MLAATPTAYCISRVFNTSPGPNDLSVFTYFNSQENRKIQGFTETWGPRMEMETQ